MMPPRSQPHASRPRTGYNDHTPGVIPLAVKGLQISWLAAAAIYVLFGVVPILGELLSIQVYSGLGEWAPAFILLIEVVSAIVALIVALGIARHSNWVWRANIAASISIAVAALALPFLSLSADNMWSFFAFVLTWMVSGCIWLFSFRYPQTRRYLTTSRQPAQTRWLRRIIEQR
jgi:hypothetical protein